MQRTPNTRLAWIALVVVAFVISVMIGAGTAQSTSVGDCETEDWDQDALDESITRMLDRFGWETGETGQADDVVMTTDETVMTAETEDGTVHVTGDVSPGETVTITLTDGLADADVTVNGEPVAPTDADGEIEVVVPEDGEVTIVIEAEHSDHEIALAGSETGTEVRSSTSSSESSTTSSVSSTTSTTSSTTVSTSTSTSTST